MPSDVKGRVQKLVFVCEGAADPGPRSSASQSSLQVVTLRCICTWPRTDRSYTVGLFYYWILFVAGR